MRIRIGINGFGRMGRLSLRAAWGDPSLSFVHINDPAGDPATLAHLLQFDSVHGRWDVDVQAADDALLLDDILAEIGPDSRVVRLFDRDAMPTPAQLKARIDRHLEGERAPDASRALHEALAELRRSLA